MTTAPVSNPRPAELATVEPFRRVSQMAQCSKHQLRGCAYCAGRPTFFETRSHVGADELAMNGGLRWTRSEVALLTKLTADLEIGTPEIQAVFKQLADQFGRTYTAVYDKWGVISGHVVRSA